METGFTWIMILSPPHVWECLPTCTPLQHTNSHTMLNNDPFTRKPTPLLRPGLIWYLTTKFNARRCHG